ncbi:MAG: Fe-S cluster assembly ATPase SufC [Clostridiales bacterium]|nr:Fe-S cluster assembly ATPase SufC [Clostridiales bacterium]
MRNMLEINNLFASAGDKPILKGVNLTVKAGEIHVIMGPNGSGKSTLANVLLGNPEYTKTAGKIEFDGEDITNLPTGEITRRGIFMSFQTPEEIPGISTFNFLKTAKGKVTGKPVRMFALRDDVKKYRDELGMDEGMTERELNVGFSGGEKKKNEILQMLVLNPKLAILDETDSGLDVDAIAAVAKGIAMFKNDENALIIITHNLRLIDTVKIDAVHVFGDGKIVETGPASLAYEIEAEGFAKYKDKLK